MGRFIPRVAREIPVDRFEPQLERTASPAVFGGAGEPPAIIPTLLTTPERDASSIAAPGLDGLATTGAFGVVSTPSAVRSTLSEVEDRRTFHPDFVQPAKTVRGSRSSMKASPPGLARPLDTPVGVSFWKAAHVLICVRRHARRTAIFATGKAGGHFTRGKPRKRNDTSNIWC